MFTPQSGTKLLLPMNQISLNGCKTQCINKGAIWIGLSSLKSHQLYIIKISQSFDENTLQEIVCDSGHLGFQHFDPIKKGCHNFCFTQGQLTYFPHHLIMIFAIFSNYFCFQVSIGVDLCNYTIEITGNGCITILDQQVAHNRHI